MQVGSLLVLRIGDNLPVRLQVRSVEETVSGSTGKPLLHIRGSVRVSATSQEWFEGEIRRLGTTGIESDVDGDEPRRNWKVRISQFSFSNEGGPRDYQLALEEIEEIRVETLTVNGQALRPVKYSETIGDGWLQIEATVHLTEPEVAQLHETMRTADEFLVTREGLDEQPRRMRFGVNYWSHNEGEPFKYRLLLLDRSFDERESWSGRPGFDHVNIRARAILTGHMATNLEIRKILVQKGILTEEEIAQAQEKGREEEWHLIEDFYRVHDADSIE